MVIFFAVLCIVALSVPILHLVHAMSLVHHDEEGNRTEDSLSIPEEIVYDGCGITCVITIIFCFIFILILDRPRPINNAGRLRILEHEQIYNILQKYEHYHRTYYFIEHSNGKAGLYWSRTDRKIDLGLGYHKLERKRHNSEKLKFTPLRTREYYCAT